MRGEIGRRRSRRHPQRERDAYDASVVAFSDSGERLVGQVASGRRTTPTVPSAIKGLWGRTGDQIDDKTYTHPKFPHDLTKAEADAEGIWANK